MEFKIKSGAYHSILTSYSEVSHMCYWNTGPSNQIFLWGIQNLSGDFFFLCYLIASKKRFLLESKALLIKVYESWGGLHFTCLGRPKSYFCNEHGQVTFHLTSWQHVHICSLFMGWEIQERKLMKCLPYQSPIVYW